MSYNYTSARHHEFLTNSVTRQHSGNKLEYRNAFGRLHRIDGPAIIFDNDAIRVIAAYGQYRWFIDGKHLSFKKWCSILKLSDADKTLLALSL